MEASPAMQAALMAAAELAKTGAISLSIPPSSSSSSAAAAPTATAAAAATRENVGEVIVMKRDFYSACSSSSSNNNNHNDSKDDTGFSDGDGEGAEEKLARNRERNREHARKTRLRKKAQLEDLQIKLKALEDEGRTLRTRLEECSVAGILLGLSSGQISRATEVLLEASQVNSSLPKVSLTAGGKRKRFISEDFAEKNPPQPLKVTIDGEETAIGGGEAKTHINWKSGVFSDENGIERQLSHGQLETLRRERNRMHAKMTRERKKGFISAIKKNIDELEKQNKMMRLCLESFHTNDSSSSSEESSSSSSTSRSARLSSSLSSVTSSASSSLLLSSSSSASALLSSDRLGMLVVSPYASSGNMNLSKLQPTPPVVGGDDTSFKDGGVITPDNVQERIGNSGLSPPF